ncbi:interferon alpha-inducible protein 27-like protein 2A [Grus americana]|uniref:Interferon alpha-inducible protein 27-like protein 2A n=1 Tax=Grus japonensis TaxID=30415 RepID=A0ABC9XP24_GRUJA|nr:interferon alpha-inducible protein 27-like protein 2A [Grus americana]
MHFVGPAIGVTIGVGLTTAVMPAALYVLGFTKAGIAAGSIAARMMSVVAMANGGKVAAGSLVATAQSLGAAGVPMAVKATLSAIGAAIGAALL